MTAKNASLPAQHLLGASMIPNIIVVIGFQFRPSFRSDKDSGAPAPRVFQSSVGRMFGVEIGLISPIQNSR